MTDLQAQLLLLVKAVAHNERILARLERKLDLLLGHEQELDLAEVLRQTHSNPVALQDYLKKKGGQPCRLTT